MYLGPNIYPTQSEASLEHLLTLQLDAGGGLDAAQRVASLAAIRAGPALTAGQWEFITTISKIAKNYFEMVYDCLSTLININSQWGNNKF